MQGPRTGDTVLPSCRASRTSSRTWRLASAPGVTIRMKCCSDLDRSAASICVHQSAPPFSAMAPCAAAA